MIWFWLWKLDVKVFEKMREIEKETWRNRGIKERKWKRERERGRGRERGGKAEEKKSFSREKKDTSFFNEEVLFSGEFAWIAETPSATAAALTLSVTMSIIMNSNCLTHKINFKCISLTLNCCYYFLRRVLKDIYQGLDLKRNVTFIKFSYWK